jgi:hypothetical protein
MTKNFPAAQSFEAGPRPPIELVKVESKQIDAIGYDKETHILAVRFSRWDKTPAPVYCYGDVSPETHAKFIGAESLGKFHGEHIKPLPFKKYHPDAVAETAGAAEA